MNDLNPWGVKQKVVFELQKVIYKSGIRQQQSYTIQSKRVSINTILIKIEISCNQQIMTNRQKNDGYTKEYKKPMDKSKYKTWPCDKGYKCPYRRLDQDGNMIKNYCTFIHHPYDLCPDKEDCQFFQTEDCIWRHTTKPKPKPKPAPVVQVKPPVAQIIQDQSEFPSIGNKPIKKSAPKTNPNNKNPQPQPNKPPTPSQINKPNQNNGNSLNPNHNNGNNINTNINAQNPYHPKNPNLNQKLAEDNKKYLNNNEKQRQNSKYNNPESNSYLSVNINTETYPQVKPQRHKGSFQPLAKVQQKRENQLKLEKQQNLYKKQPEIPKFNLQKQSFPLNAPNIRTNQSKQQMRSEASHQIQLQRSQSGNRQLAPIQRYPENNYINHEIQGQRQIDITREIEKLAKEVLKYNIAKNELQQEDYENNIKLTQILKLSNDLRKNSKLSLKNQPQIAYQSVSTDSHTRPLTFQRLTQIKIEQPNYYQQSYHQYQVKNQANQIPQTKQLSEPSKRSQPTSRKSSNVEITVISTNANQQVKAEEKKVKSDANKRVILTLEQISELSAADTKNTSLSQFLLTTFLDYITDKDHIEFKFQVDKRKFEIVQKFYGEDHKKDNKHQRYSFYSIEVLQQSHFEQLCQTITKYSCTSKKNEQMNKNHMNQNSFSLLKPQLEPKHQNCPENVIKDFFWHFFEYLQFYFKKIKKELKDKTLEVLDLFYKFVILPEDICPANSPDVTIQDPNHFKGPIYVGGLRIVCMRFFARIFLLFLQNNLYATMKLKQETKIKSPSFDSKTIAKFMQEKQEQTVKKLTGNQYKDNIECNKKKRPMDRQLLDSEVKEKLASELIARSHHLIDQIMLGQKETLLSWQSMKEYIELKAHDQIFADYIPETEVDVGKIEMVKIICKGQIAIEESDRKKYNQKEKNRFQFLESYFIELAIDEEIKQEQNEFITNKTIQIGQKSYVTLLSDGKYIIEQPFDEHRIQQHQNEITTKLKQKNSKTKNPPYHQTKIFYYTKANTGLTTCPLESLVKDPFFKNNILDFTQHSPYLIYCNQENGFSGPESVNSFKIRIHRQGGIIEFLNAKSQQQCKRYFGYIMNILKNPKVQTQDQGQEPSYFFLNIKSDSKKVFSAIDKDQISKTFSIQSKDKKTLRYKKQNLSIITWNLKRLFESDLIHRQISKDLRCKNIINDLKALKADIICLQEVKDFKKQLYEQLCENHQLYFMPFHEDIGDYETLILTRFPVKYSTVKIATQKWACFEFQIETGIYPQNQSPKSEKIHESQSQKQKVQSKQARKLSVLVMSIHLKCTEMDSQDSFLASTVTREKQLKKLEEFFALNQIESNKRYDLVIMAGDFNIDDETAKFKEEGETKHECDHNGKYLKYPPYFDLQAQLHPETLEACKTYLHKGLMENGKYRLGGTRLDRILVRGHSSINVEEIIPRLGDFSLVGNYSLRSKQNANEVNYDKFTRSPSDHFGVYMQIPFTI